MSCNVMYEWDRNTLATVYNICRNMRVWLTLHSRLICYRLTYTDCPYNMPDCPTIWFGLSLWTDHLPKSVGLSLGRSVLLGLMNCLSHRVTPASGQIRTCAPHHGSVVSSRDCPVSKSNYPSVYDTQRYPLWNGERSSSRLSEWASSLECREKLCSDCPVVLSDHLCARAAVAPRWIWLSVVLVDYLVGYANCPSMHSGHSKTKSRGAKCQSS